MVEAEFDIDTRLSRSARRLRAWNWMGAISTRQPEVIAILNEEAHLLILLGPKHPHHARRIGNLIVAYRRLIEAMEQRMAVKQAA